ncbi:hypothetical protein REPUB_Repub01dG0177700 [Reevesia pubescens]
MQNPNQTSRERFSKPLITQTDQLVIRFPHSVVAGIYNFEVGGLICLDFVDHSTGKAWTFLGSFVSNEENGSVVLPTSWPQFVSEKSLKANDEVVFVGQSLQVDDKAPLKKFKIEVKRKIRLFGQDIWGDIMV